MMNHIINLKNLKTLLIRIVNQKRKLTQEIDMKRII